MMASSDSTVLFAGMCLFVDLNGNEKGVDVLLLDAPDHTAYLIYDTVELDRSESVNVYDRRYFLPPGVRGGALAMVPLKGLNLGIGRPGDNCVPCLDELSKKPERYVPSLGDLEDGAGGSRPDLSSGVAAYVHMRNGTLAAGRPTRKRIDFAGAYGQNKLALKKKLASFVCLNTSDDNQNGLTILGTGNRKWVFNAGASVAITNTPNCDLHPQASLNHFTGYYHVLRWPEPPGCPRDEDLCRPFVGYTKQQEFFACKNGQFANALRTLNSGFCPTAQHP